jgi:hypothetical protein
MQSSHYHQIYSSFYYCLFFYHPRVIFSDFILLQMLDFLDFSNVNTFNEYTKNLIYMTIKYRDLIIQQNNFKLFLMCLELHMILHPLLIL